MCLPSHRKCARELTFMTRAGADAFSKSHNSEVSRKCDKWFTYIMGIIMCVQETMRMHYLIQEQKNGIIAWKKVFNSATEREIISIQV